MITMTVRVDPSVSTALARMGANPLRRLLRRVVKPNAKPALAAVKEATPVLTGKLRASWAIRPFYSYANGEVGVSIEPMSSFTYSDQTKEVALQGPSLSPQEIAKSLNQQRRLNRVFVTQRGNGHKSVQRAMAKGQVIDRKVPWRYAFGIETGHSPKGRLARRAGGAHMLARGIESGGKTFIDGVGRDVFTYLTTGAGA